MFKNVRGDQPAIYEYIYFLYIFFIFNWKRFPSFGHVSDVCYGFYYNLSQLKTIWTKQKRDKNRSTRAMSRVKHRGKIFGRHPTLQHLLLLLPFAPSVLFRPFLNRSIYLRSSITRISVKYYTVHASHVVHFPFFIKIIL